MISYISLLCWLSGKESACNLEMQVPSLGWKDPLEEGIATHSSILSWRIPWTEEPGGVQSMGSQGVGPHEETECTGVHVYMHTHIMVC